MKIIITLTAALALAGCSLQPADFADAGSTALALTVDGATEANPVIGALGDDLAAPVSLLATAGMRYAIDEYAAPENAPLYHQNLTNVKTFATCNNVSVWLGASLPAALLVGAGCGIWSYQNGLKKLAQ